MSHEKCEVIPPLRFEVLTSFYNDMDTFLMGDVNLSDKVRGGYNRLRHFHAIVPDEVAYKVALDSLDLESLSERLTYLPPCPPHFTIEAFKKALHKSSHYGSNVYPLMTSLCLFLDSQELYYELKREQSPIDLNEYSLLISELNYPIKLAICKADVAIFGKWGKLLVPGL